MNFAVQTACEVVVEALRKAGATVDTVARPEIDFSENNRVYAAMMASSTAGGGGEPVDRAGAVSIEEP